MMELLMNVNFAYFILILAIFSTSMAIITPGTFVAETVSIILIIACVLFANYIHTSAWALSLLGVGVVLIFASIFLKKKFIILSIGIAVLLIGSLFFYTNIGEIVSVNLGFAVFISIVCYGTIWYIARKAISLGNMKSYEMEKNLIGVRITLPYEINQRGSVTIESEDWTVSCDGILPKGTKVEVYARDGLILKIRPFVSADLSSHEPGKTLHSTF